MKVSCCWANGTAHVRAAASHRPISAQPSAAPPPRCTACMASSSAAAAAASMLPMLLGASATSICLCSAQPWSQLQTNGLHSMVGTAVRWCVFSPTHQRAAEQHQAISSSDAHLSKAAQVQPRLVHARLPGSCSVCLCLQLQVAAGI